MADPMDLIDRAKGRSITKIFKQGIGSWLLAVSVSVAAGLQEAVDFLFLPFTIFVRVANSSVGAFLLQPMSLPQEGYEITARALESLGIAAGPISTLIAMVGLVIALGYLSLQITSNFLPGLIVDNPIWDRLFGSPEEDGGDQEG